MGMSEGDLKQLAVKMGEDALRKAFRDRAFVYGTTGKQKGLASVLPSIVSLSSHSSAKAWKSPAYNPGPRAAVVASGQLQMMDMYYGNGGRLTDRRNPVISDFVLAATGMTGFGNDKWGHSKVSPRLAYMAKFGNAQEGWDNKADPGKEVYGMTTTKEISRIIRWGLGEYGGTLIYDGAEVYYRDVFLKTATPGDTALEARGLFQHFRPGTLSSKTSYGNGGGTIIFHWYGLETVPTKLHFLSTWKFDAAGHKAGTTIDRRHFASPDLGREPFWDLPPGDYRTEMCRMKLNSYARREGALESFWDSFSLLPLTPELERRIKRAP
jgi:hypothetical protein